MTTSVTKAMNSWLSIINDYEQAAAKVYEDIVKELKDKNPSQIKRIISKNGE